MITGCDVLEIVEACHIFPYRGEDDNHVENGLLLRTDLHTLFDLNLLGIEPYSLVVRVNSRIAASDHAEFSGRRLATPVDTAPSWMALRLRWSEFELESFGH
jgi:predicted restriction endonuclease